MLALRGRGNFTLNISNQSISMESGSMDFIHGKAFTLAEGVHVISITAEQKSPVDVVWLYEPGLFKNRTAPAQIINYTQKSQTLWTAGVNATEPFLLAFAETYSPFWEARYTSGGKKAIEKPMILFDAINGYWINETGLIYIELRYAPQDSFDTGLIISIITLAACAAFLLHSLVVGR
jgi:hypothetical protein